MRLRAEPDDNPLVVVTKQPLVVVTKQEAANAPAQASLAHEVDGEAVERW
jgi:hypothetical protein